MRIDMKNLKNESGTALIATLMFLMAMGVLSTALIFTANNEMMTSAAYKYNQQSYYVASAGVYKAVDWFRTTYNPYDPALGNPYDQPITFPPRLGGNAVQLAGREGIYSNYPDGSMAEMFTYQFSPYNESSKVVADEKNAGNFGINATLLKRREVMFMNPDDYTTPVPGAVERWNIDSMGFWGNGTARTLGIARITATIENDGDAFFDRALWGKDFVDLSGTAYVDSFDPNIGPWDANNNSGQMGAIGTNGSLSGGGNSMIYGDAAYGPNGTCDLDPDNVTGNVFHLSEEREFPDMDPFNVGSGTQTYRNDGDIIWPGEYGRLTIRAEVTLKPGDYYIDDFEVTSQGRMILEGPTNLFVNSDFNMQGQAEAGDPSHPEDLSVWFAGGKGDARPPIIKWAGGTSVSASIYAPYASLELTGGTHYSGSFIALGVTMRGNAEVHFDQGSLNRFLWPRPFRVITWAQSTTLDPIPEED